jgi:hypothetical protein
MIRGARYSDPARPLEAASAVSVDGSAVVASHDQSLCMKSWASGSSRRSRRRQHAACSRRVAVEVGPNGIRIPEAGWLGWDEIEEVRLEILVSPAAASDPSQVSRRIGIMPRGHHLRARIPVAQRIASLLYSLCIKRFNPYSVGPPVKLARVRG